LTSQQTKKHAGSGLAVPVARKYPALSKKGISWPTSRLWKNGTNTAKSINISGGAAAAPAAQPPVAKENDNPNPQPFTVTLPIRTRKLDPEQAAGVLLPYPHAPKPLLDSSKMRPMPPAVLERLGLPTTDSPATSAESTPQRETSPVPDVETPKDAADALPESPQPTDPSDLDPTTAAAEAPSSGLEATTIHPEKAATAATALPRHGSGTAFAGQTHRGSEISIATEEEIRAVEANNRIEEEDEESDDEEDGGLQIGGGAGKIGGGGEKAEVKGAKAADANKAGESVGD